MPGDPMPGEPGGEPRPALADLPAELVAEVLRRLGLAESARGAAVCKAWHAASKLGTVWRTVTFGGDKLASVGQARRAIAFWGERGQHVRDLTIAVVPWPAWLSSRPALLARLWGACPALERAMLVNGPGQVDVGKLLAGAAGLQTLHLHRFGDPREGRAGPVTLHAKYLRGLSRLLSLRHLDLRVWDSQGGDLTRWRGSLRANLLDPVLALTRLTRLELCLYQEAALEFGEGLSRLQDLAVLSLTRCEIHLPSSISRLSRLTRVELDGLSGLGQGLALNGLPNLLELSATSFWEALFEGGFSFCMPALTSLALRTCHDDPESDDSSPGASGEVPPRCPSLRCLSLQGDLRGLGRLLPGPGEHALTALDLHMMGPLGYDLAFLAAVTQCTTLQTLKLVGASEEGVDQLGLVHALPGGPWLGALRELFLEHLALACVPPALAAATRLRVLAIVDCPTLRLSPQCVATVRGLAAHALRTLCLCQTLPEPTPRMQPLAAELAALPEPGAAGGRPLLKGLCGGDDCALCLASGD